MQNVPVDVVGTRSVSGTFVAKDGMAVAIGGMIEESDIDQRAQVPVLGDIPGLGLLFRRQEKVKSRRELIIMVRPYVMTTPADSEVLSQDVLERLAPVSVDRLVEEGFLPERTSVTTEIVTPAPLPPRDAKQSIPVKKATISR
ncbi:MAG: hypothetical protein EOP84_09820 [Verrucomicrobiaceae bacterium]|nr:MAG: hypothetical protein EOP84_09820 [Verrucomicrobiaceae bacterium]